MAGKENWENLEVFYLDGYSIKTGTVFYDECSDQTCVGIKIQINGEESERWVHPRYIGLTKESALELLLSEFNSECIRLYKENKLAENELKIKLIEEGKCVSKYDYDELKLKINKLESKLEKIQKVLEQ